MTLTELGSLGELLGSAGVLITLVFLVVQIRQNTNAMKSTSLESVLTAYATMNREYFATSALSSSNRRTWSRGHDDFSSLTSDEQHLFHQVMVDYVFHLQNVIQLRERGILEEVDLRAWDAHVVGAVATPGGLEWWKHTRDYFTDTIRGHVDAELIRIGRASGFPDLRDPHDWMRSIPYMRSDEKLGSS